MGDTDPEALYQTELECMNCLENTTFAHRGRWAGLQQDPPWPDVGFCPHCGERYDDDLGALTVSVHNAEIIDPTGR